MAPIAIFGSKRNAMYSEIAASTTTRPVIACRRTSAPNVGPMSSTLMSVTCDAGLVGEAAQQRVAVAGVGERFRADRDLIAAHDLHLGAATAGVVEQLPARRRR